MNTYPLGSTIRLRATFTLNGLAADPTTIILKIRPPGGATSTIPFSQYTKESTGVYYYDFSPVEGTWTYQWDGTGAVVASASDQFRIVKDQSL